MNSDRLIEMHDFERSCDVDVEHLSGVDEPESTCTMEVTSSPSDVDLSILNRLRELAAARFLAAAQSNELGSALQVVRASAEQ